MVFYFSVEIGAFTLYLHAHITYHDHILYDFDGEIDKHSTNGFSNFLTF